MRFATDVGEPVGRADRFVRWIVDGRGDVARGRNLFVLRFLDAMWDPHAALSLPYRPTRNPAAFLAMAFDLTGDAIHGYLARIDGGGEHVERARHAIHRHIDGRLGAPWGRFVGELQDAGFDHLARAVSETVVESLGRPAVSELPALLAALPSWMTPEQYARFDADAYVAQLSLHDVLTLLRHDPNGRDDPAAREQHPMGGDLRALIRRRLDHVWCRTFECGLPTDRTAFLATLPFDVASLADGPEGEDFALAYAIATDAAHPGRLWPAPPPYVHPHERAAFEAVAARGPSDGAQRRESRLRRWGVSATFPATTAALDRRLDDAADLHVLHAGAPWRDYIDANRDALEVARRHFLQRVADALAEGAPS